MSGKNGPMHGKMCCYNRHNVLQTNAVLHDTFSTNVQDLIFMEDGEERGNGAPVLLIRVKGSDSKFTFR